MEILRTGLAIPITAPSSRFPTGMVIISRKLNETIQIHNIYVTVADIKDDKVRLLINAPARDGIFKNEATIGRKPDIEIFVVEIRKRKGSGDIVRLGTVADKGIPLEKREGLKLSGLPLSREAGESIQVFFGYNEKDDTKPTDSLST